jgi:serine/threonine protein kinase
MPAQRRNGNGARHAQPSAFDEALAAYVDRLAAGERLDPVEILTEHPDVGEEILACLEGFVDLEQLAECVPAVTRLGDYVLRRRIGRGGMGVVYEAQQLSMDRRVALKVLPAGVAADRRAFLRFLREAQTAGRLQHPSIVSVYAMGVEAETPFYAMELIEGETLARVVQRLREGELKPKDIPFGKGEVDLGYYADLAKAFAEVADGLHHAHSQGVVHRDIKPSNLIVDWGGALRRDGEAAASTPRLRILDFGLAHLESLGSLTLSGDLVGTPFYMSPEQVRRAEISVDHRTDIYSLGATLFEMATLRPPFTGRDRRDTLDQVLNVDPPLPRKLNPWVPSELETIVLKCLEKDPDSRYRSAEALAQDLRRFARGDAIEARPQARWERLVRRIKRHRTPLLVALLFVVLAGLAGWLAYRGERSERARRLAEYPAAVREAASKLSAGEFSLRATVSSRIGMGSLLAGPLTPFRREELERLLGGRGAAPVAEAARHLEGLVRELPDERDAHYHLARAYRLLGRSDSARTELERTLEVDPGFLPAEVLRHEIDGETAGARARLAAISGAEGTGRDWRAWWLDAYEAAQAKQWDAAAAAYERLIAESEEREPYLGIRTEALLARGAARLELKEYERAAEDLAVARFLAPGSLEASLLLGKAYFLAEKKGLAQQTFAELRVGLPDSRGDEVRLWVAVVYASLDAHREALAWASELEESPFRARLEAYLFLKLGDWDAAVGAAREVLAADADDLTAHFLLASALRQALSGPGIADESLVLQYLEAAERIGRLSPQKTEAGLLLRLAQEAAHRHVMTCSSERNDMDLRSSIPQAILAAALAFGAAQAARADEIVDDFRGATDPFDCDPLCWNHHSCCPAIFTPTEEGLEVSDFRDGDSWLYTSDVFAGDVTVVVHGSFNGTANQPTAAGYFPALEAGLHFDASFAGYYAYAETIGRLNLLKFFPGGMENRELGSTRVAGSFEEGEVRLEIRTVGERIEVRLWQTDASGGGRPEAAHISVVDHDYRSGVVVFGVEMHAGNPIRVASVAIRTSPCDVPEAPFRRGDANADGSMDISDGIFVLGHLFLGGGSPTCSDAADADDNGSLELTDAVFVFRHLFLGSPPPSTPGPASCGQDPSDDGLHCETYAAPCL